MVDVKLRSGYYFGATGATYVKNFFLKIIC